MAVVARYPDALIEYNTSQTYDFPQVIDGKSVIAANLHNKSYVEIVAIESELGTNVSGSQVDLKTRLNNFLANDGSIDTSDPAYFGNTVEVYDGQVNLEFISDDTGNLELGDVVVCTTTSIRGVKKEVASNQQHRIAGVVSEVGPVANSNLVRVCTSGYVAVKVDGAIGNPIQIGTLLILGTISGRATAAENENNQNVFGIVVDITGYSGTGTGTVVALLNVIRNISAYSGSLGISGYSGYSGIQGVAGFSGFTGTSGTSGNSGYSGESLQGVSGTSGAFGYSGISGYSGASGESGAMGPTALGEAKSGASGVSGYSGAIGSEIGKGQSGISGYSGARGQSGCIGYSGSAGQYSEVASENQSDLLLSESRGGIDVWSELGVKQTDFSNEYILDSNHDWRDKYIEVNGFYKEANEDINEHLPGGEFQNNIVGFYRDGSNLEKIHSKILGGLFYSGQGGEGNPNICDKANLYFEDQSDDGANKSKWQIFVDENSGSLKIKISSYNSNSWVFLLHVQASPKQNHYS